jgi:hypothetical protein
MRFITIFALTSIVLTSLLYGFILGVDPYNKFNYNLFNFETKAVDFARENKFNQIEHGTKNYEAFLLGSSPAHRFETKEIKRLTGLEAYNYAIQSGTPEDYVSITRHIFEKFKPKLLILVLDFESISEATKTDDMFYSSPLKKYLSDAENVRAPFLNNAYLTLDALSDSFKVVWVNLFGKASHTYLENGDHIRAPLGSGPIPVKQFNYDHYKIDKRRLGYLQAIRDLANKNGAEVIVLTSPVSLEHLYKITADHDLSLRLLDFKRVLVEIFGELHDFMNLGIADYNDRTFFNDSNHPTHDFSTLILEKVLKGDKAPENPEFGKILKQ